MNEQELAELDKLATEAMEDNAPVYIRTLGEGLWDALVEVRRLNEDLIVARLMLDNWKEIVGPMPMVGMEDNETAAT